MSRESSAVGVGFDKLRPKEIGVRRFELSTVRYCSRSRVRHCNRLQRREGRVASPAFQRNIPEWNGRKLEQADEYWVLREPREVRREESGKENEEDEKGSRACLNFAAW